MKKKILLGVTGSIAAYKACELAKTLSKDYHVDVIITKGASEFVTPLSIQTLTGNPVQTDLFNQATTRVDHIELAKNADLILIAPASANIIGKMANGIGDDLLSTVMLVNTDVPRLIAPAMNTNMYANPIVQDNIERLKKYGWEEIKPRESMLACGDYGVGAMALIETIVAKVKEKIN